jgi:hypothetical protein
LPPLQSTCLLNLNQKHLKYSNSNYFLTSKTLLKPSHLYLNNIVNETFLFS